MTCIAQSQVIYYSWRIALFGRQYHKLEWFTYRTVSSRGGEPLRKWLKLRFRQNIFLSLLYTIYKFWGSVPKPSPRGQILETALFTWLTLANVIIAFISYKNLSKAENPVVVHSWKKRRQLKSWNLKIKKNHIRQYGRWYGLLSPNLASILLSLCSFIVQTNSFFELAAYHNHF